MITLTQPTGVDDTEQINQAFATLLLQQDYDKFSPTPTGDPQYVLQLDRADIPWRFNGVVQPSNTDFSIHADATVQPPVNAGRQTKNDGTEFWGVCAMVTWGPDWHELITNVSISTHGTGMNDRKTTYLGRHERVANDGVSRAATVELDPEVTGATNNARFLLEGNITGGDLGRFYFHGNATNQPDGHEGEWPQTASPAVVPRADRHSPLSDNPADFIQPRNVNHHHLYGDDLPRGYGIIQFQALIGGQVNHIHQFGGTCGRFETDSTLANKNTGALANGGMVDQITGDDIVCINGNRAVSFTPHGQANGAVHLVTVESIDCFQGVVLSRSGQQPGVFTDATIENLVVVGGMGAQRPSTLYTWEVGLSEEAVKFDGGLSWKTNCHIGTASSTISGTFNAQ